MYNFSLQVVMEEIDIEILQDMQEQMNRCTSLSLRYVSIVSRHSDNIPGVTASHECQQILKMLLSVLMMENDPSRVLSFLSVPIRFVVDENKADMVLEETQKVLNNIRLCWQDKLLDAIFPQSDYEGC